MISAPQARDSKTDGRTSEKDGLIENSLVTKDRFSFFFRERWLYTRGRKIPNKEENGCSWSKV